VGSQAKESKIGAMLPDPVQPDVLQAVPSDLWGVDWVWGVPLIASTVIIHVLCLGLINQRIVRMSDGVLPRLNRETAFVIVMGVTTILATVLHGIEAALWAFAYRLLGALPDSRSAMLYSLSAMTSYGHTALVLKSDWQLLGALEALNGWLLFGLTTAFLFSMIDKVWSHRRRATSKIEVEGASVAITSRR
jgi:hypothetical protein